MTEIRPEDRLLEEIGEQGKKTLHYSRTRLLATWLAIALLAMLTGVALFLSIQNGNTNNDQTEEIARVANTNAEHASKQADQTTAYLKGDTGIPGVPGSNGQDGSPGLPSSEPGPEGKQGPKGDTGTAGTAGTPGQMGQPGSTGGPGPVGTTGEAGAGGAQGPAGPKGDKGAQGEKGDEGARGATGATGPAGPPGSQGPPGSAGSSSPVTTAIAFAASANDTTAHKVVTVTCASGRASGGGFATVPSDPGIDVSASSPVGNTGWSATADVPPSPAGTNWQLLAFVTCVS